MSLTPLLNAAGVEIVSFVAGKGGDHICALESHQADRTLFMLAEFVPVKESGKLGQRGTVFLALLHRVFVSDVIGWRLNHAVLE